MKGGTKSIVRPEECQHEQHGKDIVQVGNEEGGEDAAW